MMRINRGSTPYTAFFCEENIWWLASRLVEQGTPSTSMHVLFFSNKNESALMLNQASALPGQSLTWDYHVVLLARERSGHWIFDPDSRLPFPTPASKYINESFPQQDRLSHVYRTIVRIIPAASYCERFYSDRSHMRDLLPAQSFPDYPIIKPAQHANPITLAQYRDFDRHNDDGSRIVPLSELDVDHLDAD